MDVDGESIGDAGLKGEVLALKISMLKISTVPERRRMQGDWQRRRLGSLGRRRRILGGWVRKEKRLQRISGGCRGIYGLRL